MHRGFFFDVMLQWQDSVIAHSDSFLALYSGSSFFDCQLIIYRPVYSLSSAASLIFLQFRAKKECPFSLVQNMLVAFLTRSNLKAIAKAGGYFSLHIWHVLPKPSWLNDNWLTQPLAKHFLCCNILSGRKRQSIGKISSNIWWYNLCGFE